MTNEHNQRDEELKIAIERLGEEVSRRLYQMESKQDNFIKRAEPALSAFENTTLIGNFLRRLTIGLLKFLILLGGAVGAWLAIKEFILKK